MQYQEFSRDCALSGDPFSVREGAEAWPNEGRKGPVRCKWLSARLGRVAMILENTSASEGAGTPGPPWFAIRVKSNYERVAAQNLRAQGYEEYVPLYKCVRRWPTRTRVVELPLFPGYIFSRFDPNHRTPILKIPGVVNLVCTGKTPAAVDAGELAAISRILSTSLEVEPCPYFQAGERVVLRHGPLCGLEGTVVEAKSNSRLVVSVTLLQRSVAVEIDPVWASAAAPARNWAARLLPPAGEAAGGGPRRFMGSPGATERGFRVAGTPRPM